MRRAQHPSPVPSRWALAEVPASPQVATRFLQQVHQRRPGDAVTVVSERLVHAAIQTTLDRYAHVLLAMDEDAVSRFAAILGNGGGEG